jgi:hypothetical protein
VQRAGGGVLGDEQSDVPCGRHPSCLGGGRHEYFGGSGPVQARVEPDREDMGAICGARLRSPAQVGVAGVGGLRLH